VPASSSAGVIGAGDTYSRACPPTCVASVPIVLSVSLVGSPNHTVCGAASHVTARTRPTALTTVATTIPRRSVAHAMTPEARATASIR
jgi:hypothetical protein